MTLPEHYEVIITDEQRANLIKLADRLGSYDPPPHFGMSAYMTIGTDKDWVKRVPTDLSIYNECDTVACAVGHGPYVGIPGLQGEMWEDYAKRVFGASTDITDEELTEAGFNLDEDYYNRNDYQHWQEQRRSLWYWCFSGAWANIDNTPKGAAARIRYALEHGIPYNYAEVQYGYAPLPYTV